MVEQEQESATLYSWIEGMPSSLSVHITGGEKWRDSNTGRAGVNPTKQIRFNKGIFHTSDPETIAVLRKKAKSRNGGITEDYELYLSHVLPVEDQKKRAELQLQETRHELNRLKDELQTATEEVKKRGPGRPKKEAVPAA